MFPYSRRISSTELGDFQAVLQAARREESPVFTASQNLRRRCLSGGSDCQSQTNSPVISPEYRPKSHGSNTTSTPGNPMLHMPFSTPNRYDDSHAYKYTQWSIETDSLLSDSRPRTSAHYADLSQLNSGVSHDGSGVSRDSSGLIRDTTLLSHDSFGLNFGSSGAGASNINSSFNQEDDYLSRGSSSASLSATSVLASLLSRSRASSTNVSGQQENDRSTNSNVARETSVLCDALLTSLNQQCQMTPTLTTTPPLTSSASSASFDMDATTEIMKKLSLLSSCIQPVTDLPSRQATISQEFAQAALELQNSLLQHSQQSARTISPSYTSGGDSLEDLERLARMYRTRASFAQPTYTWRGTFPQRVHASPTYSTKIFLGGVPWDISELGLKEAFADYGILQVQVPRREATARGFGYVYIILESDFYVKRLLSSCTFNGLTGEFFFKVSSRRIRQKEVQVIPWIVEDSNFVRNPSALAGSVQGGAGGSRNDSSKTVFVGALHGMMRAEDLAIIMDDLFGSVIFAGIDTDKYKYPIGSGRVSFFSESSYHKAVQAGFIEVKTSHFTKKIQVDPYIQDALCSICNRSAGIVFCRNAMCFRYYCRVCWSEFHKFPWTAQHEPLMRNRSSHSN